MKDALNSLTSGRVQVVLISSILLFHLLSIAISPMPWFDEVCFADISNSLLEGNGFNLVLAPYLEHHEHVVHYGPVFFTIQAGSIWALGLNTLGARLPAFLFSIASFFLFRNFISRTIGLNVNAWLLILIGLSLPTVSSTLHNGRMEFVGLFFWVWSLHFISRKGIAHIFIASLLISLMLLTSPRSLVLVFGHGFLILWYNWNSVRTLFYKLIIFGGVIFLMEYAWALYSAGGLMPYLDFMTSQSKGYIGGGFPFLPKDYPLLVLIFSSIVAIAIRRRNGKLDIKNELGWYCLSIINIVVYLFLVNETGPYLVYLVFSILILTVSILRLSNLWWRMGLVGFTATVVLIQFVKFGIIASEFENRSSEVAESVLNEHIPPNSVVLASDVYYYMLKEQGHTVHYLHHLAPKELLEFADNELGYTYLVLADYEYRESKAWKGLVDSNPDKFVKLTQVIAPNSSKVTSYTSNYGGVIFQKR